MKKRLYLIGGPMGVGKTTVCQILKRRLERAVFLDGDWCWDADPFQVTDETKQMVLDNIRYLLNSFLGCPAYQNILFCWVMHEQSILDAILSGLALDGCEVCALSLVCTPEVLEQRLQQDIRRGLREPDCIPRSQSRLPLYDSLHTRKIDVSHLTPEQTAERIAALL